jgi:phosphohistidine phosphatase
MKTLIIMRHAKTEEGKANQKDFDRELITRGTNDAEKMAEWIEKKIKSIDEIFSSTALRTMQTAGIVKKTCGGHLKAVESLYHADANDILEQIQKAKEGTDVLLIVGHNPAISNLASYLSDKIIELKPSDVVLFSVKNKEWDSKLKIDSAKHHSVY